MGTVTTFAEGVVMETVTESVTTSVSIDSTESWQYAVGAVDQSGSAWLASKDPLILAMAAGTVLRYGARGARNAWRHPWVL